ncbi:glutamine-dependent NAD(+) synthetase [bacterium BMS3Bbin06]|nr:glutamine-dependent NAD(+) synthetase [bacterium BMS3Abin08]GBE34684.1 glutamine-dependent NAD(+) synthetase [bacterium BMS3Bbin06]HDY70240.1 NAD+ synthase [Nitrospirota bacterium]
MRTMRLALSQINTTVGDIEGNTKRIIKHVKRAEDEGADIVAFPEMAVTGYPPEDLLLKPQFINDNLAAIREIRNSVDDIVAVVGYVDKEADIFNAAAVIHNRHIVDVYHKIFLPNYGVFDEMRYFQRGSEPGIYRIGEATFGINICEDVWYPDGPMREQAISGAEVIININASPYQTGKSGFRENMLSTRASDNTVVVAYLNSVGGQDELVFDGQSLVFDQNGALIYRGAQFSEDFILIDIDLDAVFMGRLHDPRRRQDVLHLDASACRRVTIHGHKLKNKNVDISYSPKPPLDELEEVYNALLIGTRDYVDKNDFDKVLVGLSGGIDSAFVATIAVDALGRERVKGVFMPSPYTSDESTEDVRKLAGNLGLELMVLSIDEIFRSYLDVLKAPFEGTEPNVAEENIQARIRGNILMAISNKFNWIVLTTGNKSEMSVGYATLYGDMAGGFAVIKDVPKTLVYKLAEWRNKTEGKDLIPGRILWKEPSAELKPDQKDSDTLPPYEELDKILRAYVEEDRSFEQILKLGCEEECSRKVITMIDRSEYKRRQAPPGIKITPRAFGRDRRFPITNRYRSF